MKRIDDKIKEIEKKDKTNRVLYIGFVVVIAGFMFYALQAEKKMKAQDKTITEQLENEKELTKQLKDTIYLLKQSQTPLGFWNETKLDGTAKSYIDYITHIGMPKVEYSDEAVGKIESANGKTGWLFAGRMVGGQFTESILDVVWRKGNEENYQDSKPQKDDILVNTTSNRYTYSDSDLQNKNPGSLGWVSGSKVFVMDVKTLGSNAVYIKIKF